MDLSNLHLEEMIVFPGNYWEVIAERRELTPELVEGGFVTNMCRGRRYIADPEISIEIKKKQKAMLFYFGDECKGKTFFEFELGTVLSKVLRKMDGLEYDQELSHWFSDAVSDMPEIIYKGLNVAIYVPETCGDVIFENFK